MADMVIKVCDTCGKEKMKANEYASVQIPIDFTTNIMTGLQEKKMRALDLCPKCLNNALVFTFANCQAPLEDFGPGMITYMEVNK